MIRLFILSLAVFYSTVNYANNSINNNILILGDSLSTAYGINPDDGWVKLLESKLTEEKLSYTIINASISGETTVGAKNRIQGLLDTYKPGIVLLELGGNDGLRGFSIKVIRSNLLSLVEQSLNSNAQVLLAGMKIPPNYGVKYTELFMNSYQELHQQYPVSLIPFFLEGVAGNSDLMQNDGIHPNASAQPVIMQTVWRHLLPLLTAKP